MKNLKRIFASLLAVAMLVVASPVYALTSFIDDVEIMDLEQDEIIALFKTLDIIKGYEDGEFHGERTVTRAEMATFVVKALKLEPAAPMNVFDDVALDHWANGYITRAYAEEIIVGDGNGKFRPEDQVSYAEMFTMLVNVLGYEPKAELAWPTNYTTRAREIGLTNGIYGTAKAPAIRDDVAVAIWNMLNIPALKIAGSANGEDITLIGNTILANEYEKVALVENAKFDYFDMTSKEDEDFEIKVKIGNKKYIYNENDFYTIPCGTKVDILVVDNEIVAMELAKGWEIIKGHGEELNAEELDDAPEFSKPNYHYVALKDGDFKFGMGMNEVGNSVVVEKVNLTKAVKKVEFIGGGKITVDEEAMNEYMFIIDGERTNVADVKAGDVLTEIAPKIFVVSRNTVAGEFERFTSDKIASGYTYNTVEIDDEEYRYTINTKYYDEDYKKMNKSALEEGTEVVAYLTNNNEVVAIVAEDAIETYGIVESVREGVIYLAGGEEYDCADRNGALKGDAVIYHFVKGEVVVDVVYTIEDALAATTIIDEVNNKNIVVNGTVYTQSTIEEMLEIAEYEIYLIDIDVEDKEFDDVELVSIDDIKPSFFEEGDRIEIDDVNDYIVIVRGF